jgi:thiosulfate dehydrogenase [quinone] large subunit
MTNNTIEIPEPKLSKFLFADARMAWLWLIVRVYVGYEWFMAGYGKFTTGWVGTGAGKEISGFFTGVLAKTAGEHPSVMGWYAWFISNVAIPHATFFSNLITFGELAVGIGLIVGAFVGIAAFFGAFMNFNFLFAGTTSINPLLGLLAIALVLAWRNAGWLGLDRFLLPSLGVPWMPGAVFRS